jgi:hypothetical protein
MCGKQHTNQLAWRKEDQDMWRGGGNRGDIDKCQTASIKDHVSDCILAPIYYQHLNEPL